jgi:hypothetical protein
MKEEVLELLEEIQESVRQTTLPEGEQGFEGHSKCYFDQCD